MSIGDLNDFFAVTANKIARKCCAVLGLEGIPVCLQPGCPTPFMVNGEVYISNSHYNLYKSGDSIYSKKVLSAIREAEEKHKLHQFEVTKEMKL